MKTPKLLDIVDVEFDDGIYEAIIIYVERFDGQNRKIPKTKRCYSGIITMEYSKGKKIPDEDRDISFGYDQITRNRGSYKDITKRHMMGVIIRGC